MKTKVNLTIENEVLINAKKYAATMNESLSRLVEEYLKSLEKSKNTKSLIEYVENLDVPSIAADIDFKKEYYSDKSKKYGN
jgi:hypothetical protein